MIYLDTAVKLVVGLLTLIFLIRILGKKHLAEMTPYDIVYLLIFGGILEEALYDKKVTIWQFLFSIFLWAAMIYLIEKLVMKHNFLRMLLKGAPDKLIEDGKINKKLLEKNSLEMEQLRSMLRQQGIFTLREVKDLFIEPGGEVSINQYAKYKPATIGDLQLDLPEEHPTVLLVDNGEIKEEVLEFIHKTKEWLLQELKQQGYNDIRQILYCEWSKSEGFFIRTEKDTFTKKKS